MKRGFVRIFTITAAMVSMLSTGMTVSAAENYTVAEGDHLMKIAQEKYGDSEKWNIIYEANKETIKEPTKIYPGQVIVIPDPAEIPSQTLLTTTAAPAVPVIPAAPAVQPETAVPATPAAPAVQPETAVPATPAAPAVQPEVAVPATPVTPAVQPAMTLEEYYKDPEFRKELDDEMQMFNGSGMEVSVAFQGNTMAVIVRIMDSSYITEGAGDVLNEAMEAVRPTVMELVAMLEEELGNPGNCAVIFSYQTADGQTIAQKAFTAK